MTQPVLSVSEFRALITQQGLTCREEEIADFYHAYGLVRAMAARVRKPRGRMAEPMATFAPITTVSN